MNFQIVQIFVWASIFISLEWIPGSGIAGLYGKLMFNFLGNRQVFSKVAAPFYIPTVHEVLFSPHPH